MRTLTLAESARFRRRLQAYVGEGYERKQLAEMLGCSRTTVYSLLQGTGKVRKTYADSLAKVLRIPVADLYKPPSGKTSNGLPRLMRLWLEAKNDVKRRAVAWQLGFFLAEYAFNSHGVRVKCQLSFLFSGEPDAIHFEIASKKGTTTTMVVQLNHNIRSSVTLMHVDRTGVPDYKGPLTHEVFRKLLYKISI